MTTAKASLRAGSPTKGDLDITKKAQAGGSHSPRTAGKKDNTTGPDVLEQEFALIRIAQAVRHLRSVRRHEFGLAVEEPAWDMLVELYVRENSGGSTTGAQLIALSHYPPSTARRWLQHLVREGFVITKVHATKSKTEFVELTDSAREALDRYFTAVREIAIQQAASKGSG